MAVCCGGLLSFSAFVAASEIERLSVRVSLPPTRSQSRSQMLVVRAVTSEPSTAKIRGIMKPRKISPEMQALFGVQEISRTQALKQIWAYIKENNLQDPENKRIIKCDEKLKKVFAGRDQVGMLEIAGLISPHFLK